VKATEVTAGPVESNGSLLPGLWHDSLHVTCGLTACTPGSAPGTTLGNEYGKTLPFTLPSSRALSSKPAAAECDERMTGQTDKRTGRNVAQCPGMLYCLCHIYSINSVKALKARLSTVFREEHDWLMLNDAVRCTSMYKAVFTAGELN